MRYAVYFVPRAESALGRLGATWMDGLGGRIDDAVLTGPRHYLFHATLKPPFRLTSGSTLDDLIARFREVARRHEPIVLDGLNLLWLGPYVTLVSADDPSAINTLAFDCVTSFDQHRAALTDSERQQRTHGRRLTKGQEEMLDRWGYPYVGPEFRFHMTLAGPVLESVRPDIEALARNHFDKELSSTHAIDEIAIAIETSKQEPMSVVERIALSAAGSETVA